MLQVRKVGRLLRSLARNVATYASEKTLTVDLGTQDAPLSRNTVDDYLTALTRLMIVEDQPAWAPHLRSRYVLRSAPKRHFVDPSLAAAAIGASPEHLIRDPKFLGFLFESLVVRDLRIYAQGFDARVFAYRDSAGLEVDCIVETRDGRWAAFEVKLGPGQVDAAAQSLIKFADRIDTSKCGKPAALGVITSHHYGYLRKDGIAVVPLAGLGP